jgi:anti-sigma B factor antagonist
VAIQKKTRNFVAIIRQNDKQETRLFIMNTKFEEINGKYVATLIGEMDTAAAAEAEEVLKPLYTSNGKDVVIDCTDLEYIASSGLRILLGILKGAKASGSKVVMRGVNDDIKSVFKLTGFINIFEFE